MWTQSRLLSNPLNTQRKIVKKKTNEKLNERTKPATLNRKRAWQPVFGAKSKTIYSLIFSCAGNPYLYVWIWRLLLMGSWHNINCLNLRLPKDRERERAVFKIETMVSVSKFLVRQIKSKATLFDISCYNIDLKS